VRDRANHGEFVEPSGKFRQVLANADTGQGGLDRAELPANAIGSVRLGVKSIDVARAAEKIDEDHGFRRCGPLFRKLIGDPGWPCRSRGRD
jgi:hypothetical protein